MNSSQPLPHSETLSPDQSTKRSKQNPKLCPSLGTASGKCGLEENVVMVSAVTVELGMVLGDDQPFPKGNNRGTARPAVYNGAHYLYHFPIN